MAETVMADTPGLPPGPDPERQAAARRHGRLQRRAYLLALLAGTGEPRAFISMLARLHDQNLSEARPPRWAELLFWDHPPNYRRVAEAQRQLAAPGPA